MRLRKRSSGTKTWQGHTQSRSLRIAQTLARIAGIDERIELVSKKYGVDTSMVRQLLKMDPLFGKYLDWIVKNYRDEEDKNSGLFWTRLQEISGSLQVYLKLFNNWNRTKLGKQFLEQHKGTDIFKYTIPDLLELGHLGLTKEYPPVYDKNGIEIYKIGGPDQSPETAVSLACMLGWEGKWCTKEKSSAEKYLKRAPLYVVRQNGSLVAQFSPREGDFEFQGTDNTRLRGEDYQKLFTALLDFAKGDSTLIENILKYATDRGLYYSEAWMSYIKTNPVMAVRYAIDKSEFLPESEPYILQHIVSAVRYALRMKEARWPELEKKITDTIKNNIQSLDYYDLQAIVEYSRMFSLDTEWAPLLETLKNHIYDRDGIRASSRVARIAIAMTRVAGVEERIALLAKKYQTSEGRVRYLLDYDPTGGKYLEWVVKNVMEETDKKDSAFSREPFSVMEMTREYLTKFDSWKKTKRGKALLDQFKGTDISKYSIPELFTLIREAIRSTNAPVYDKNGVKIYQVGGPDQDPDAALEFACSSGAEGDWCTRDPDTAQRKYLSQAPLLIVYYNNKPVAQLHAKPNSDYPEFRGISNKSMRFRDNNAEDKAAYLALLDYYQNNPKMTEYLLAEATSWGSSDFPEELMPYIIRSPQRGYQYAMEKDEPVPEAEPYILQDILIAVQYASYVKRVRWPELEKKIMQEIQKAPDIPSQVVNAIWTYVTRFDVKEIFEEFQRIVREKTGLQQEPAPAASRAGSRSLRIALAMTRVAGLPERMALLTKKYELQKGVIDFLLTYDPTGGKYLDWIARNFKIEYDKRDQGVIYREGFATSLEFMKKCLVKFDEWKKTKFGKQFLDQYKGNDISKYTMPELFGIVRSTTRKHLTPDYDKNGVQIYQAGGPGQDPETAVELACSAGLEGDWCSKDPGTAKNYMSKSPLYIIYVNHRAMAQLHVKPGDGNYSGDIELRGPSNSAIRFENEDGKKIYIALLDFFDGDNFIIDKILTQLTSFAVNFPPELLPYMLKIPVWAVRYAVETETPLPEAEPLILQDIPSAVRYAIRIKGTRWPELEHRITKEFQGDFPHLSGDLISAFFKYEKKFMGDNWTEIRDIMTKKLTPEQEPTPVSSRASHRLSRLAYQLVS